MCIALIGGMDRLEKHYRDEAGRAGIELRVSLIAECGIARVILEGGTCRYEYHPEDCMFL